MKAAETITTALPALSHRNFRLFWGGQLISVIGTWMQNVALGWLVLRISDSSFYLGLLNALTTLPILLFSLFAGIIADRVSKRRMIIWAQAAFLFQALLLAALVYFNKFNVWTLMALAALAGTIQSFDSPARQSFVSEMVPHEHVLSAVALNSAVFNAARTIGPAIGGLLISSVGESACFFINAVSFIAVIAGLLLMRENELFIAPNHKQGRGNPLSELKESFRHVFNDKRMLAVLAVLAIFSIFGLPAFILLPVFARNVFHVGAKGMGFLFAAAGAGSFTAAIILAFMKKNRRQGLRIILSCTLFSLSVIGLCFTKNFYLSLPLICLAGFGGIAGIAMANSTLQLLAPDHLRGRVMGLYIFMFLGMMPPGNLLMGALAHMAGAQRAVLISGAASIIMLGLVSALLPQIFSINKPAEAEIATIV